MVKLSLRIVAVEEVQDGVVVIIQQEKMQIPEVQDTSTDEAIVFKKFAKGMKTMGINFENVACPNNPRSFRTGLWFPMEDYEAMGKPTVGDMLGFDIEKEKVV